MNLGNLVKELNFDKFLAKKVIIASPFSVEYDHRFFPNVIRRKIKVRDENFQQWALIKSDFFSESDWRAIQLNKLKNIFVHASRNVPYWRKLFKKINFNPENFRDFEDLRKIPIITRADIKKIPIEELIAKNIPCSRFIEATTSGSTGEPLKLFQDTRDILRRRVTTYETMRYMGFPTSAKICKIDLQRVRSLEGLGLQISPIDMESAELRKHKIYPTLIAHQPQLLLTTPSHLERFLFFSQKDKFFIKIKAIVYIGESISDNLRTNLEDFFSTKVFSAYGTREISPLGIHCNEQGLHVVPWMNYIEVVDENGKSLANGCTGKIVVTSFENEVMPFIRYQIGDYGMLNVKKCICSRQTKIIEPRGRILGNIKLIDGSAYPVSFILGHIDRCYFSKIKNYQLEQNNLNSIIFRYVSYDDDNHSKTEDDLKRCFKDELKNKIQVVLRRQTYISPNADGKTPIFIQRMI